MLSRPLTTLACSLALGLVLVPVARAALHMDVTASTAEIHAGVTKGVTFTVTLTSDGGDQRFTLWDALPRFGPPRGEAGLLEGSELRPQGPPAIEGPARLV